MASMEVPMTLDAVEVMRKHVTVNVKWKRGLRVWLGINIIKIGGWLSGAKIEIEIEK